VSSVTGSKSRTPCTHSVEESAIVAKAGKPGTHASLEPATENLKAPKMAFLNISGGCP
jgi:hypothetical protein